VMTKLTAVIASLFMVTCLSLAILSTKQNTSVVDRLPASVNQLPMALPPPAEPVAPQPAKPSPAAPVAPPASTAVPSSKPAQQ